MPIALVSYSKTTGGTVPTQPLNSSGANLLLAFFSAPDGSIYTDATDVVGGNSNTTWVDAPTFPIFRLSVSAHRCGISRCLNPTYVGAGHTFSAASAVAYQGIVAAAFSGVDSFQSGSDVGVSNNASGTSHITAPGTITPSADGALIVSLLSLNYSGSAGTVTPPAGFTLIDQIAPGLSNWAVAVAYMIQGTAAAVTPTWTTANNIASCGSCNIFLPSAGGGGGGGKPIPHYMQQ